jgi:ATP-dependent helicase/nuclease subunit A
VVDEARRVFYVAVTRARQRLVMSGLAKQDQKGHWQISGHSPLAWLKEHYQQNLPPAEFSISWPDPEVQVEQVTAVQAFRGESETPKELPAAWGFSPEAAPYQVSFPSSLAAPPAEAVPRLETGEAEAGEAARLRGEVTHRALETLAIWGAPPDTPALAAALRQAGMPAAAAAALAPEIQAELQACRDDPFLAGLLKSDLPFGASEWLLEDQGQPGLIRRGVIDRLVFDGQDWWLLDFKSSRPAAGEDSEVFFHQETEKYRPQLLAYREMAAKAKGIEPPAAIRLALYFTAIQKAVEI